MVVISCHLLQLENIDVHVSRMSGGYLQNMKLIQILGLPPKYFNITIHNWIENWVLNIAKSCFHWSVCCPSEEYHISQQHQSCISPSISHLQPSYLGIIHAFKCHYRKQLIWKTVAMIDGVLLQDTVQMKLDVLSAIHLITEAWRLMTTTAVSNWFMNCGFSNGHQHQLWECSETQWRWRGWLA
jgi:hypothetical protein